MLQLRVPKLVSSLITFGSAWGSVLVQRLTQNPKTLVSLRFRLCIILGQTLVKLLLALTWLLQWKKL